MLITHDAMICFEQYPHYFLESIYVLLPDSSAGPSHQKFMTRYRYMESPMLEIGPQIHMSFGDSENQIDTCLSSYER